MGKVDQRIFYTNEAASYEITRYGSRYGRLFRILQRSAVHRSLEGAKRILDVATGTGQMLPVLARTAEFVVASDLTPAMLYEARNLTEGDHIVYCVGNAAILPYRDGSFDIVASSRFLHLFELEIQGVLIKEMVRVLRPGGSLLVDFYSADARETFRLPIAVYRRLFRKRPENDHRVSLLEAREMLEKVGLKVRYVQGLGNFLLIPLLWLPLNWLVRVAEWLCCRWPQLSEQFLVVAHKP